MSGEFYRFKVLVSIKSKEKYKASKRLWHQKHKECENKRSRDYYTKNRERISKQMQARNQKLKNEAIMAYSTGVPKCNCCGIMGMDFLSIDHVNGDGWKQKKRGSNLYLWLRNNGYPCGFQVLCFNCNCAKGLKQNDNTCPHQRMKNVS